MSRPILLSRSAGLVPGDHLRELRAPVTTRTGRVLPRGTRYRTQCGGYDNRVSRAYVTITVGAETLTIDEVRS